MPTDAFTPRGFSRFGAKSSGVRGGGKEAEPRARGFTQRGFEVTGAGLAPINVGRGPGEPPPWFAGTKPEWYYQWALMKLGLKEQIDFDFQSPLMGGRHEIGGAVVDFVVYQEPNNLGIRIVTYQFHEVMGSTKQERDFDQGTALQDMIHVLDVFERYYIHDPTGAAVLEVAALSLQRIQMTDPLTTGLVVDVS